ncbi:hypothetical protein GDO78_020252 [Eleutherodactylus coqui]|uniref:Otoancorin n=2 Tax=Eleutherodactylus coqui TaxID=57060 RepID=A0A8J6BIP4_ELECQ|nr:hypothetical protein GDO78_020252 [Eleutherodactylus coqui]
MNSSYTLLRPNIQKAVYHYLLDYHKQSKLSCDTFGDLQLFINTYFEASSTLLGPEDLVSLIPNDQLSTKLNSLQPQDLVFYLQPDTNTNSTLWSIILSHYANISKLGQVMDPLNIKTVDITVTVFKTVWPIFVSNSGSLNSSEMDKWFNVRFNNTIKLITLEQLNITEVITASCLFYQNLVKTLSMHYEDYSASTRQDIYDVFRKYLQTGPKPRCYTDDNNSWMVNNLQVYLTFCSADDLRSFSNEVTLQQFSVDNKTLALVKTLSLKEDLKVYYAQLLTTENPDFPLEDIPQSILCYAIANLNVGHIAGDQAIATLKFLKMCNYSNNSTVDKDALPGLLSSVPEITSQVLTSLGSLAVGLSTSTILQITNGSILLTSMSTLSATTGWSVTQASAIVIKVIQNNYQVTVENLEKLRSLVIGLPSSKINNLTSKDILSLSGNLTFTTYMEQAPVALRQRFVQRVIQASSAQSIFLSVPANLASAIPASNLVATTLNISQINRMKWTRRQAQVFFQTLLIQNTNYSILSSNILQGFTCGAAKNLNEAQFVNLIKSMTGKLVNLESSQLNCLAKRLSMNGAPADFASYPNDVLLYLGPYTKPSVCADYFTLVGKANIDQLAQGSVRRTSLLSSARRCLSISNTGRIAKETLQKLGNLVCDLTAQEILNSDSYILKALKNCSSFTDSQRSGILQKLKAIYGAPSTWTVSSMDQIGSLASSIEGTTLRLIDKIVRRQFFPGFLTAIKIQYKKLFTFVMSQLKVSLRLATRAAPDCEELTTDMIAKQKEYIVVTYTAVQLDTCLSNKTLRDNLETLGSLAFDNDQLKVLKNKLDTVFPTTVPELYLLQMGNIASMYSTKEISQWNITAVDTLAAVLGGASWATNDSKINALVTQYLRSSNVTFDGTALSVLAPYICGINETLIRKIPANELRNSIEPLDLSTCTQGNKDLLYSKMKAAYSSYESSSNAYFQIMRTVLGGAPSQDLVVFAKGLSEMDLTTFTGLNPAEVKKLNAENIKNLIGINFLDINMISRSTVLQAWVSAKTQTEVNKLGLNATGGVRETLPDGFIVISPVTETSGASSLKFTYLLYFFTIGVIFSINNLFL